MIYQYNTSSNTLLQKVKTEPVSFEVKYFQFAYLQLISLIIKIYTLIFDANHKSFVSLF